MGEIYSPELKEELDSLLEKTRQSGLSATRWYIGTSVVVLAMQPWSQRWTEALVMTGILGAVLLAIWAHYWLTKYRIEKGYFPGNEHEAREAIEHTLARRKL